MEGWGPSIFRNFHPVHRHVTSLQNVSLYPPNDGASHVSFKDNKLLSHYLIHLTFNRQRGQCHPITSTSFSSQREYTVLMRSFELNSVPVTAENWHLEGHMLRDNNHLTLHATNTTDFLVTKSMPGDRLSCGIITAATYPTISSQFTPKLLLNK